MDPGRVIQITEWFDDETLNKLTPNLIQPRPNTYTYTKALAEHVLATDGEGLPVVIVRPSIGKSFVHFIGLKQKKNFPVIVWFSTYFRSIKQ